MDQSTINFITGLAVGVIATSGAVLVYRARQYATALGFTEYDEPMTHGDLYAAALEYELIPLIDNHAQELCEEFGKVKEELELTKMYLDEAMARKSELHMEVENLARLANKLHDQVMQSQMEVDHCRACCDELRAKLDAKVGA